MQPPYGADEPWQPGGEPPDPADPAADPADGAATEATAQLEQTRAELALLRRLAADGYEGPAWEEVASWLVTYAHPIILAWIRTMRITERCLRGGLPFAQLLRNAYPWSRRLWRVDDAEDLATETIVLALQRFKVHGGDGWDPRRGASLRTYFLRQCLWAFLSVYRSWLRQVAPLVICAEEDLVLLAGAAVDADPHELVALREELAGALALADDRVRLMLDRRAAGYSNDEIGAELGMTGRAVESALYRFRRRIREQWRQRTASQPEPRGERDGYQAG